MEGFLVCPSRDLCTNAQQFLMRHEPIVVNGKVQQHVEDAVARGDRNAIAGDGAPRGIDFVLDDTVPAGAGAAAIFSLL